MTIDNIFNIVVIIYSMSNLASLGMELNLRETIRSLGNLQANHFYLVFWLDCWTGFCFIACKSSANG